MAKKSKEISSEGNARTIVNETESSTRTEFAARAAAIRARQLPNKTRAADLIRK
jgi:hypothetical protein